MWTERMLEALERGPKNGRWHCLIDKVYAPRSLRAAWEKVAANNGAAGVDKVSVARFAQTAQAELETLSRQLREGRYKPQPVRRVWIDKLGSTEQRPLGIPAVRDRIVQTALRMVLEPIFERDFAPESFGFRPGRGCQQALERVEQLLAEGYTHVVDADLKSYFGHHPARAPARAAGGEDRRRAYPGTGDGIPRTRRPGRDERLEPDRVRHPARAVVSPLLANLYLDALDWKLRLGGWELVRYADDFVVLCRTRAQAEEVLALIGAWSTAAGLQLHPQKTRLVDMTEPGGFDFLGYHFERDGRRWPREKSMHRIRQKLRGLTRRTQGESLRDLIADTLNPVLRGWHGYFWRSNRWTFKALDGYVRGRLRGILRKRHGGRGRGRGRDHQRWPNRYFAELKLLSLEELWRGTQPAP